MYVLAECLLIFMNLLLKGKPVYTLIFIHICKAMLTALTGSLVEEDNKNDCIIAVI